MEAGYMPKYIDVDIKNAIKVKIKTYKIEGGKYQVGFFEPRFVK